MCYKSGKQLLSLKVEAVKLFLGHVYHLSEFAKTLDGKNIKVIWHLMASAHA